MDFQINSQQQLGVQLQGSLDVLKEKGYAESTLAGYKSFIRKAWDYISQKNLLYSLETSQNFILRTVPELPYSDNGKKHMRTSIRRFNDYLSNQPYVFRQAVGHEEPPDVFKPVLEEYISFMTIKGLKPATIEVRRIFATQFLNSIFDQGVLAIKEITRVHVGAAVLSVGSIEGICQKLPHFLKYLKEKGLTELNLDLSVPHIIEQKTLPSIYSRDELLQILTGIDRSTLSGKRNYAIMLILAAYGLRAKDLAELKTENVNFQHRLISFKQSKTGNLYQAVLLPTVQTALEDYLADTNPSLEDKPVFCSIHAPFRPLNRSAVWSIVSKEISLFIETKERRRGPHAIRSSMASGLVADNVPYPIVQKILGHVDPNATRRYVAIDIERLRGCALECPMASGLFLSYLEGGSWK